MYYTISHYKTDILYKEYEIEDLSFLTCPFVQIYRYIKGCVERPYAI